MNIISEVNAKEEMKQFNVSLPSWLIASVMRYKSDRLEKIAKSVKTGEVVGQALFYYLGPFGSLSLNQAIWKILIERAEIELEKEINGQNVKILVTAADIAQIFRKLRDSIEGDSCLTSQH